MKFECYDNDGCYTVIPFKRTRLRDLSHHGQPFMAFNNDAQLVPVVAGPHLGKRVGFASLPQPLREAILARISTPRYRRR